MRPLAYFLAAVLSVLLHCSEQCRAASAPRDRTVTTLTRLDEIHRLSVEAAASKIPVKVEATVTFYAQAEYLMFLANESGYGYVLLDHHLHAYEELQAGDLIEVQGVTSPGGFLPMIIAAEGSRVSIVRKGRAPLPEPERATCGEITADPDLDCHWLETEVLVSHVFFHPPFAALELNCENTSLRAIIPGFTNASTLPWDLAGRRIRAQGVAASFFNNGRQLTGRTLCIPSTNQIQVLDRVRLDDFSMPLSSIASILTPGITKGLLDRVHVRGVVTYCDPNEAFCVQDETGGAWVRSSQPCEDLHVGDLVDVVARPLARPIKPALGEARFRIVGKAAAPFPKPINLKQFLAGSQHSELVTLSGELVDARRENQKIRMMVRVEGEVILTDLALHHSHPTSVSDIPAVGSVLQLTGVARRDPAVQFGSPTMPREAMLRLRFPSDIRVLSKPPPFTLRQALTVLGPLLLVALLAATWAISLRRRVSAQSVIIREQAARDVRKEERLRIAADLHDSLQQHLVGLGMQMKTVLTQMPHNPEEARCSLELASRMVRHSQVEAHQSIWNLKHRPADGVPASQLLEKLLEPILIGNPGKITIRSDPTSLVIPSAIEQEVSRVVQESVTNAAKHAGGSPIDIQLSLRNDMLTLQVSDQGPGFDPAILSQPGRFSFGITGMKERAGRISGELTVRSAPGQGTTVVLKAPLHPASNGTAPKTKTPE